MGREGFPGPDLQTNTKVLPGSGTFRYVTEGSKRKITQKQLWMKIFGVVCSDKFFLKKNNLIVAKPGFIWLRLSYFLNIFLRLLIARAGADIKGSDLNINFLTTVFKSISWGAEWEFYLSLEKFSDLRRISGGPGNSVDWKNQTLPILFQHAVGF